MKQALCRFIYYKVLRWKSRVSVPDFDKCIYCAAPHTTNWDLLIGKLFISAIGRDSGFMMKKEWFFSRWESYSDGWAVYPSIGINILRWLNR